MATAKFPTEYLPSSLTTNISQYLPQKAPFELNEIYLSLIH